MRDLATDDDLETLEDLVDDQLVTATSVLFYVETELIRASIDRLYECLFSQVRTFGPLSRPLAERLYSIVPRTMLAIVKASLTYRTLMPAFT